LPRVSIVLPVYNSEEYLSESIESILNQTFTDLELVISYDESSDKSFEIINGFMNIDNRVVLSRGKDRGISKSLNDGIKLSQGGYIARMDADDISIIDRIEKQVNLLDSLPHVEIVGGNYYTIDKAGKVKNEVIVPKKDDDILSTLIFTVPFAHPSVMMRKSLFKRHSYEESPVEDYLLWVNLYKKGAYFNLDEFIIKYRHDYGGSISDKKRLKIIKEEGVVARKFISENFFDIEVNLKDSKNYFLKSRSIFSIYRNFSKKYAIVFLFKNPAIIPLFLFQIIRHLARVVYKSRILN
jgi:glycosyltransferase involved in cell wall biosynthesis